MLILYKSKTTIINIKYYSSVPPNDNDVDIVLPTIINTNTPPSENVLSQNATNNMSEENEEMNFAELHIANNIQKEDIRKKPMKVFKCYVALTNSKHEPLMGRDLILSIKNIFIEYVANNKSDYENNKMFPYHCKFLLYYFYLTPPINVVHPDVKITLGQCEQALIQTTDMIKTQVLPKILSKKKIKNVNVTFNNMHKIIKELAEAISFDSDPHNNPTVTVDKLISSWIINRIMMLANKQGIYIDIPPFEEIKIKKLKKYITVNDTYINCTYDEINEKCNEKKKKKVAVKITQENIESMQKNNPLANAKPEPRRSSSILKKK